MAKPLLIDLTGDSDDDDVQFVSGSAAVGKKRKIDESEKKEEIKRPKKKMNQEPNWVGKEGVQRLMLEFRSLRKDWGEERPRIFDLEMVNDQSDWWRLKVNDFDDSSTSGRNLNTDLATLGRTKGQDYIVMEIKFPKDYPTKPFFLRLISPRMCWYTGHITAGGAICIEALTTSGTPGSWHRTHCVEGILRTVFTNMLHAEEGIVRTATGPGGKTGPLRVDLHGKYHYNVLAPYTEHEAKSAFDRMLRHHATNGW
eukprot:CAMPEP_0197293142 /NCGR_PEP_ID=MMETSP0890-20130614/26995_1 /TAXON_ID=44058 ORGANISM="Aureoumbra lagunensis, Strain CCMP1510" /NCGR_SAMPLE_ID=MMETSP0890 /ASSEMBLY_ACC=CAM_ASM_000533 /LENGTH=254 /DNA_ID=CAMNT_0042767631 /DNA_START=105 /DNA_END=872 /DNA_ORIENTATION=-